MFVQHTCLCRSMACIFLFVMYSTVLEIENIAMPKSESRIHHPTRYLARISRKKIILKGNVY